MTCEVCGDPTKKETSDVPADDGYVSVHLPDDNGAGLPVTTFRFCSLRCARQFIPNGEGVGR